MLLGSFVLKNSTSGTFSPKQFISHTMYMLMCNCLSFAAVSLNREWISPFSLLDGLTTDLGVYQNRIDVMVSPYSLSLKECVPVCPLAYIYL